MSRTRALSAVAVAVVLGGCGSSSSSSSSKSTSSGSTPAASSPTASTPAPSGGGSRLTLIETDFKITPATKSVSKGTIKITVKNSGATLHALNVEAPSGEVMSGSIAPGATKTITLNATKPGSYTLYCPIDGHRRLGMVGKLIVGGGGAAASTGGGTSTSSTGSGGVAPTGSPPSSGSGY